MKKLPEYNEPISQEEIERLIAEFLSKGGTITVLPYQKEEERAGPITPPAVEISHTGLLPKREVPAERRERALKAWQTKRAKKQKEEDTEQ
jgi:hypothetical protein